MERLGYLVVRFMQLVFKKKVVLPYLVLLVALGLMPAVHRLYMIVLQQALFLLVFILCCVSNFSI